MSDGSGGARQKIRTPRIGFDCRGIRFHLSGADRSGYWGWRRAGPSVMAGGELIPTTMLRVLRGKILRPETVHASELIIAVERPLLLDKMPMVANVQAAPAQPGRTQTPFGNGRALRRWQSGRGRSVRISRIPVPVSAADRKKPRFLSPPSFAPPVYPGVPSLIPHALLDAGLLGSQQELRSG